MNLTNKWSKSCVTIELQKKKFVKKYKTLMLNWLTNPNLNKLCIHQTMGIYVAGGTNTKIKK